MFVKDKNLTLDIAHVTATISTLAHFHGASWRWIETERLRTGLTNRKDFSLQEMQDLHNDTWFLGFCFKQIFRLMRPMLRKFLENRKQSERLINRLDKFMKDKIFNIMKSMWTNMYSSKFDTILHGDLWTANILYKYNDMVEPEKAIFVDFQQIDLGNPCRDIMSFIFTSTDSSFRANHMDSLLKHYFTIFRDYFCSSSRMSSCSYEDFYGLYVENRKFEFSWALYMICIVLWPEVATGASVDIPIRDVLVRRFESIASIDENVPQNFLEIRTRLMDLINEGHVTGMF